MDGTALLIELSPKEINLLLAIRNKFRYGNIVVVVRDGVPQYVERVTERDNLETLNI